MSQEIQAQYQGFCNTHILWKKNVVFNIEQFVMPQDYSNFFHRKLERKYRLGQLAEQFVFNQIETCVDTELLAQNIQIQKDKNTLGELDALIVLENKPIHLEIIYKYYVFDSTLGASEIECWIGPNRKDSLIEKLTKLKEKQLPLLYTSDCKNTLKTLELNHFDFEQRVLFKAQLFVPFQQELDFVNLNEDCNSGFYIKLQQLNLFVSYEFYIPEKLDWLIAPHLHVDWMDYSRFKDQSSLFLENKQSPLFWLKDETHILKKAFLVWW